MSETKPFQIRIEPELLSALQAAAPRQPGKPSGAGRLLRRLAGLFVGNLADDGEDDPPNFPDAENYLSAGNEAGADVCEVGLLIDDLVRFAHRTRDPFQEFRAFVLIGRLELLAYRLNHPGIPES